MSCCNNTADACAYDSYPFLLWCHLEDMLGNKSDEQLHAEDRVRSLSNRATFRESTAPSVWCWKISRFHTLLYLLPYLTFESHPIINSTSVAKGAQYAVQMTSAKACVTMAPPWGSLQTTVYERGNCSDCMQPPWGTASWYNSEIPHFVFLR